MAFDTRGSLENLGAVLMQSGWRRLAMLAARLALGWAVVVGAGTVGADAAPVDFQRDVRPILADRCLACHGFDESNRQAGLRLDTYAGATAALADAAPRNAPLRSAFSPGDIERSEAWRRIVSAEESERMPPPTAGPPLTAGQRAVLKAWIEQGAEYTEHWSFAVPRRGALPDVHDPAWCRNAVDRFVLAGLQTRGLRPAVEAAPETLLRRLCSDLTGLPPSPALRLEYLRGPREDAVERLVDRLMASRAYAERQAQDWLDLARYADTNGFADDGPRDIWPFRDWVIDAIAEDMPFDRFTIEQLAGDLLPGATESQRIASAFHRNAPQAKGNTYPVEEYRVKGVLDRVNTTARVWLGLTLECAQCHDHKFDPLTQRDYFGVYAIFNQIVHTGSGFEQGGPLLPVTTPGQRRQLARWQARVKELESRRVALDGFFGDTPPRDTPPRDTVEAMEERARIDGELAAAGEAIKALEAAFARVPVMQELAERRETFVHVRGNFLQPGERVTAAVPTLFQLPPDQQPRDRLEFARWLVHGRHPLVARVVVNRLWQSCFGRGLVATPADLGVRGAMPTHPELLDWLACELVSSGWDVRRLHRLLVTSATYRQAAAGDERSWREDPRNEWLGRAARPRLAAEQLRDQSLAVAGLLDLRVGGPSVFPEQPENYWEQRALPGRWQAGQGSDRYRRGMYTYWRRMALHPTLELLDAPARTVCTAQRARVNVPTQALVTLNDPLFVEATEAFARRLTARAAATDSDRIDEGFELLLVRQPTAEERERMLAFVNTCRQAFQEEASSDGAAGVETRVWYSVAAVLLNLDEALCRP